MRADKDVEGEKSERCHRIFSVALALVDAANLTTSKISYYFNF